MGPDTIWQVYDSLKMSHMDFASPKKTNCSRLTRGIGAA